MGLLWRAVGDGVPLRGAAAQTARTMRRLLNGNPPVRTPPLPGRRGVSLRAGFGLVLALIAGPAAPAEAYNPSEFARGWFNKVWGPGETALVAVVDSPRWETPVAGLSDFRRLLQEALDVWANIPTADIRWEVGPTIVEAEAPGTFPLIVRYTGFTQVSITLVEENPHCTVMWGWSNRTTDPRPVYLGGALRSLIHELGHCLGLDHPDPFVRRRSFFLDIPASDFPAYWRYDPAMSYGEFHPDPRHLTADDRIGASLLRPREGWLETTGAITGWVTLPGGGSELVYHAYVLATLLEPASRAFAVGVFTDQGGHFSIRGLPPGEYQLLIRAPMGRGTRDLFLHRNWWALELRQTLRAGPVRVRTGEESGPVRLTARRRGGDPFR